MAKINQPPPNAVWPWGGPRSVRDRLVTPAQLDRKKKTKAGNPKNPALASAALLDFIGPAHSSEDLRLPQPPHPGGHEADLAGYSDRGALETVAERSDGEQSQQIERNLSMLQATPDRIGRMQMLLQREAQMLDLMSRVHEEVKEIQNKMREEQKEMGF